MAYVVRSFGDNGRINQAPPRECNRRGHGPQGVTPMSNAEPSVPYGYCHCGCGELAPLASATNRRKGRVKGEPCRFIRGHNGRRPPSTTPDKLCACGCGEITPRAPHTSTWLGWIKDEPREYVPGHAQRKPGCPYEVDANGCWVWQRNKNRSGYGMLSRNGRVTVAHIHYYEEAWGAVPSGLQLDHLCRNRACVNPDHLEPVTRAENVYRGANSKLSKADVRAIRASTEAGITLARRYGVCNTTISRVRLGKAWKEVRS